MPATVPYAELVLALGIGLLIGLERGWKDRTDPDGTRVAGFRTIGLIGFLGGLTALIDPKNGFVIAAGFIGLALLLREGFEAQIDVTREVSVTTMVAALTAYTLGAIAVLGHPQVAAAGAVLTTLVLWLRKTLHALLHRIEEHELSALLRWLLISVVVLPVLPNEDMGPYGAFNPRTIWWMVVAISGLGFLGYLAVKWLGHRRGLALMALAGGLVSSSAVTLSFANFARDGAASHNALIGGTAIAWAIMIVRTFLVIAILLPGLLQHTYIPLTVMLVLASLIAALYLTRKHKQPSQELHLSNPLDLGSALLFAALLAGAMFLSRAAADWLGDAGIYGVSMTAGALDIDAVSLSMTQIAGAEIPLPVAGTAICLAAIANTLFKGGIAAFAGGGSYGRRSVMISALIAASGAAALAIT